MTNKNPVTSKEDNQPEDIKKQLEALQLALQLSQEREKRALADCQNLTRRYRDERLALIKLANKELLSALLVPLDYLNQAADHLKDKGLDMVVGQIWQLLTEFGVKKIEAMGKKFNVNQMEAVDKKDDGDTVIQVLSEGYTLNDEVIKIAKVITGKKV